jgi:group I intron endonuclease
MTAPIDRYAQGKIYKLVNDVDYKIYVGSTCLALRKRLHYHKTRAKSSPTRQVYAHLSSVGWENVKIVLIEAHPCSNKDELIRHERCWVDELKPSLNRNCVKDDSCHDLEERRREVSKDDNTNRAVCKRQDL